jgi:hypothetical protein
MGPSDDAFNRRLAMTDSINVFLDHWQLAATHMSFIAGTSGPPLSRPARPAETEDVPR